MHVLMDLCDKMGADGGRAGGLRKVVFGKKQALQNLEHAVLPAIGRGRRILKRKRPAASPQA